MIKKRLWLLITVITCSGSVRWSLSIDVIINAHLTVLYRTGTDVTGEVVYDFDDAQSLLQVNIGSLLAHSPDPEHALTAYMRDLQQALRQQTNNQHILKERRADQLKRRSGCLQQKSSSDREFSMGVRRGATDEALEQISQASAKAWACAEQARIRARAYGIMMTKTQTYTNQMTKRFTVIRSNESFLIKNRDLISADPSTIIQVNRLIKQLD